AIHRSPSLARGAIMSKLPASVRVTAWLRICVHSLLVVGPRSMVPSFVVIQPAAPHTSPAAGSTIDFMISLTSATGRNGGGWVRLHALSRRRPNAATILEAGRIGTGLSSLIVGHLPLAILKSS